jgi:hypothetical protein
MIEETKILVAADAGIAIRSAADIPGVAGACLGSGGLILTETDVSPEFFDLRTGIAGDLFQKFINYRIRVAIVVPDPRAYGERFIELAREHSSHSMIRFAQSLDRATAWLSA